VIPEFSAYEWRDMPGYGRIAYTHLDRDTPDFGHLISQSVSVDGATYTCKGVERFAHCAPWRAGEKVGLLVVPNLP
jgi:hypothetical protein